MEKIKEKLAAIFRSRGMTSTATTALLIGILIALNVIVYALTVGFGLYIVPRTEAYDFSLSEHVDELFASAREKGERVKVMFCRPEDEMPTSLTDATDEVGIFYLTAVEFLEKYPDFIEFEYVNILTRRDSKGNVVDLAKYQIIDAEGNPYPMYETSVVFISGDRHKTIVDISSTAFAYDETQSTTYYTSYCGQEIFASMVNWVLSDEHKTVYFTTYHSEKIDSAFVNMMSCAGYNVESINLRKEPVPDDAALVVISNPQTDFQRADEGSSIRSEIERLRTYVEAGGNLYVALDPYVSRLPVFESFLKEYGIAYSETVADGSVYRNIVRDSNNSIGVDNFTIVASYSDNALSQSIKQNVEKYNDSSVIVKYCSALELSGIAKPLLLSSGSSSVYAGKDEVGSSGNYCIGAVASTESNDGKVGNIFVMPSISLTSNNTLLTDGYANRDFVYSLLEKTYGAENLPYGCSIFYLDTGTLQNLTNRAARIYTVALLAIPVAIAVCGAVVVTRRKNR